MFTDNKTARWHFSWNTNLILLLLGVTKLFLYKELKQLTQLWCADGTIAVTMVRVRPAVVGLSASVIVSLVKALLVVTEPCGASLRSDSPGLQSSSLLLSVCELYKYRPFTISVTWHNTNRRAMDSTLEWHTTFYELYNVVSCTLSKTPSPPKTIHHPPTTSCHLLCHFCQ